MGLGSIVVQASAAEVSLKRLIQLTLIDRRETPYLDSSKSLLDEGGRLRVSLLADLCPREEVLAAVHKTVRRQEVSGDLGTIFAHGAGLHWALQNRVLTPTGALIGVWRCVECAKQFGKLEGDVRVSQSMVRRPRKCDCGCEDFIYREQFFINEEYRIGGHPDGFLVLPGLPGLGVVEFKSINPKGAWEVKQMPNLGHVVQLQTYMWLTGLTWGRILYWDKAGIGLSALIEHMVERDEAAIDAIKATIKSIWDGIASGFLPSRLCATSDCPRAAKCPMRKQCFEEAA